MEPQNVGDIVAEKATDNVTATAMQGNLSESLLAEMRDLSKKRLFFQRIATCCLAGVFLTVFTACLIVVPKAMTTLTNINNAAVKAGSSLDDIDTMTEDITTATNNLNELVSNNSVKLTDAVTSLSQIDFEGLNKAITDLQTAVGPMANLMKGFR
ncbi:hypothetical protein [Butyrivibrio sp. LB2008]|uniref:hypothetical protein n=1 Tax=Butyrivibrio sp. LB2008 TaxID=1408305 RepID=UPI00047EDF2A|nr:hypothetical protein [Butyrivibrio sp. LB2008]